MPKLHTNANHVTMCMNITQICKIQLNLIMNVEAKSTPQLTSKPKVQLSKTENLTNYLAHLRLLLHTLDLLLHVLLIEINII